MRKIVCFLVLAGLLTSCAGDGPTREKRDTERMKLHGDVEAVLIVPVQVFPKVEVTDGATSTPLANPPFLLTKFSRDGNTEAQIIYRVDTLGWVSLDPDAISLSKEPGFNYFDISGGGLLRKRVVTDERDDLKRLLEFEYDEEGELTAAHACNFRFRRTDLAREYSDTLLVKAETYDPDGGLGTVQYTYDENGKLAGATESLPGEDLIRYYTYDQYGRRADMLECKYSDPSRALKRETYEYRGGEKNYRVITRTSELDEANQPVRTRKSTVYYRGNSVYKIRYNLFLFIGINMKPELNEHGDAVKVGRGKIMTTNRYEYDETGNFTYMETTLSDGRKNIMRRLIQYYDN